MINKVLTIDDSNAETDFEFSGIPLILGQATSSDSSSYELRLRELKIWIPMRTQHDLIYNYRMYQDEYFDTANII